MREIKRLAVAQFRVRTESGVALLELIAELERLEELRKAAARLDVESARSSGRRWGDRILPRSSLTGKPLPRVYLGRGEPPPEPPLDRFGGFTFAPAPVGSVYFIAVADDPTGPVKIGFTLGPVEKRKKGLQTSHAQALTVLGYFEGTRADEQELHSRLWEARKRGEWFERGASLAAMAERCSVAEVARGG